MVGLLNTSVVYVFCCRLMGSIPRNMSQHKVSSFWNWNFGTVLLIVVFNMSLKWLYGRKWLYNHPVLWRCCWSPEWIRWKNCIHLILSLVLLPPVTISNVYFFSVYVLIPSADLLLPWSDLLWCLSRVLMRLSKKARGVTGGLDDNYPSTPFHLTMVQASTTDLLSDVHSCNITEQKGEINRCHNQ